MADSLVDVMTYKSKNKDVSKYYSQCKRCFMTGKACIYQREISRILKSVESEAGSSNTWGTAFMLMPFRSTLDEVYRAQLEPCLLTVVENVWRADNVARTGYVICEKICKQIQLSQIICAEISCDNPNVFYELGLSYALDRNISLFIQKSIDKKRDHLKKMLSLASDLYNSYDPFEMLEAKTVNLWNHSKYSVPPTPNNDSITILLGDTTPFPEVINGQELSYSIDGLCRGAVSRTLDKLLKKNTASWPLDKRHTVILSSKGYIENNKEITFQDVENRIRNASCVIVSTHESQPSSYFWLGFAHGLEKDVIPITVEYKDKNNGIDRENQQQTMPEKGSSVLPFDTRALWHIAFPFNKPIELEDQLQSILEIVTTRNKDKYFRNRFWQPFFEEGTVSVFVGSVELTQNKRHVVGEWDYRTVSELTRFFSSLKETMETVIQPPTFQASTRILDKEGTVDKNQRKTYVEELVRKLKSGNSIILASADVNDMTEVALASHGNIQPFESKAWKNSEFSGIVAFKHVDAAAFSTPSVYFQSIKDNSIAKGERGFYDVKGGNIHRDRTYPSQYTQYWEKTEKGYTIYYSHIAKFRLPQSNHWTVVLQGITGPATLGVTQALTGGINEQFTIFNKEAVKQDTRDMLIQAVSKESSDLREFLSEQNDKATPDLMHIQSEKIAKKLTVNFNTEDPIEAIIRIFVMDGGTNRHDERLIIWWDAEVDFEPRNMLTGRGPK